MPEIYTWTFTTTSTFFSLWRNLFKVRSAYSNFNKVVDSSRNWSCNMAILQFITAGNSNNNNERLTAWYGRWRQLKSGASVDWYGFDGCCAIHNYGFGMLVVNAWVEGTETACFVCCVAFINPITSSCLIAYMSAMYIKVLLFNLVSDEDVWAGLFVCGSHFGWEVL